MKLTDHLYTYDASEFFPIFVDGELDNKVEFVAYKAEKFAGAIGSIARRTVDVVATAGSVVLDHIAQ